MMMYGPSVFGPLHALGGLLLLLGVVLLLVWAIRTLSAARLRAWGIGLLVAGAAVCALSTVGAHLHGGMGGRWGMMHTCGLDDEVCMIEKDLRRMEKGGMMEGGMMKHDMHDGDGGMGMPGHDAHDDMMAMSMHDMAAMLDGKTGDAFDKAFLEGMIPHHQGAVDMAEAALENARHEELKALARDIIASQQREIAQMEAWLEAWFAASSSSAGTGATR